MCFQQHQLLGEEPAVIFGQQQLFPWNSSVAMVTGQATHPEMFLDSFMARSSVWHALATLPSPRSVSLGLLLPAWFLALPGINPGFTWEWLPALPPWLLLDLSASYPSILPFPELLSHHFLSLSLVPHPHTLPILEGSVKTPGILWTCSPDRFGLLLLFL